MDERSTEVDQISQKLEIQRSNYEWQLNCISSADNKAGFLVTVNLVLFGFILTQIDEFLPSHNILSTWSIVLLSFISLSTLLSLFFATRAIWPRFSDDINSIFYFISIRNRTRDQYNKEIECIDPAAAIGDLNQQVWILSGIAQEKFQNIRNGIIVYGISILFLILIYLSRFANG